MYIQFSFTKKKTNLQKIKDADNHNILHVSLVTCCLITSLTVLDIILLQIFTLAKSPSTITYSAFYQKFTALYLAKCVQ